MGEGTVPERPITLPPPPRAPVPWTSWPADAFAAAAEEGACVVHWREERNGEPTQQGEERRATTGEAGIRVWRRLEQPLVIVAWERRAGLALNASLRVTATDPPLGSVLSALQDPAALGSSLSGFRVLVSQGSDRSESRYESWTRGEMEVEANMWFPNGRWFVMEGGRERLVSPRDPLYGQWRGRVPATQESRRACSPPPADTQGDYTWSECERAQRRTHQGSSVTIVRQVMGQEASATTERDAGGRVVSVLAQDQRGMQRVRTEYGPHGRVVREQSESNRPGHRETTDLQYERTVDGRLVRITRHHVVADTRQPDAPAQVAVSAVLTVDYTGCAPDLADVELPMSYASQVASGLDWVPSW